MFSRRVGAAEKAEEGGVVGQGREARKLEVDSAICAPLRSTAMISAGSADR